MFEREDELLQAALESATQALRLARLERERSAKLLGEEPASKPEDTPEPGAPEQLPDPSVGG
jgi:hypothetical protein